VFNEGETGVALLQASYSTGGSFTNWGSSACLGK